MPPRTCPNCKQPFPVAQAPVTEAMRCPACGAATASPELATVPPAEWGSGQNTKAAAEGATPGRDALAPPGYEVLGELGRGGMGVVYRARQTKLARVVALKMILSGSHAGEAELARFRTEAEAIARLQHPNIVQVFEVGEHDGRPYFSLEFCPGGSLDRKLSGTPLSPAEAAALLHRLAAAMHVAHQASVVHRDLKPANILLGEDGTPKITDFGLAKKLDEQGQTQTGAILGTPSYLAPEQAEGRKDVGPGADVYALGAILYECLTGRPPFRAATTFDTIVQVIGDEPVAPRRLNGQVPGDLETVALKCLRKQPGQRYVSAADLADDLRRWLKGEPVHARPVGRLERAARWTRRNPAWSALIAVCLLAVAALAGLAAAFTARLADRNDQLADEVARAEAAERDAKDLARREGQARQEAEQDRTRAQAALRRAEANQYLHRIALADRQWLANNVGEARRLLAECPADLRRWEWHYIDRLCHAGLWTRTQEDGGWTSRLEFSPDGRFLAAAWSAGTVRLLDAATGRVIHSFEGTTLAFRPRSKELAVAGPDGVDVWNVDTGKRIFHAPTPDLGPASVSYSPDGKWLACTEWSGTVTLRDPTTGQTRFRLTGKWEGRASGAAFAPDGRLAFLADRHLRIWDITTRKEVLALPGAVRTSQVNRVSFSDDGKLVAALGTRQDGIKVWDAASGKLLRTIRRGVRRPPALGPLFGVEAVSPEQGPAFAEDVIVYPSYDQVVRLWDARTGEEVATLRGHEAPVVSVAVCGRTGRVASGDLTGTVKVWPPLDRQDEPEALAFVPDEEGSAYSRDGARQAAVCPDKGLAVRDLATGRTLFAAPDVPLAEPGLTFSPEGRSLAAVVPGHTVKVWDLALGKEVAALRGAAAEAEAIVLAPGGRHLAVVTRQRLSLWDVAVRRLVMTAAGRTQADRLRFSPDGRLLAGIVDEKARAWETTSGKARPPFGWDRGRVFSVEFAPRSDLIAVVADGVASLYEARTGRAVCELTPREDQGEILGVAFSPNGRRIVSTGIGPGAMQVWDAGTGKSLTTLHAHGSGEGAFVASAAFSPDGRRIASVAAAGQVILWDADSGQEVLALRSQLVEALPADGLLEASLAFSASGGRLALHIPGGGLCIWDATRR